jgi:hypothetical protein
MQIEGLISTAPDIRFGFAMKTTGKKWSIVVIQYRKCSRKEKPGKHVDSNKERPLRVTVA